MNSFDTFYQKIWSVLAENRMPRGIFLCDDVAREMFGSSGKPDRRGYIYNNGDFLNLADGADHREINSVFLPDDPSEEIPLPKDFPMDRHSGSKYMIAFMNYASAVRWAISGNRLLLSWIKPPNHNQKHAMMKIIEKWNIDDLSIDIYDTHYRRLKSIEGSVFDEDVQKYL